MPAPAQTATTPKSFSGSATPSSSSDGAPPASMADSSASTCSRSSVLLAF